MAQANLKFPTDAFEVLEAEVKTQEMASVDVTEIIPIVQVNPNAETLGNLSVAFQGKAGHVTGKPGEKLNTIEFTASKATTKVFDLGFAIPIDLADIRSASMGNLDSSRIKMEGSRVVYDTSIYDLALTGGDVEGLTGLSNLPAGTAEGQVSTTTQNRKWAAENTTAEMILTDMLECYNRTATQTDNVRPADTMILPLSALITANSKFLANSSQTAMQAFRQAVQEGTGRSLIVRTNAAFGNEMLMYQFDRDVLRMNVAQTIRYLEEERDGLGYLIPVHYRYSGLQVRNSFAMARTRGFV